MSKVSNCDRFSLAGREPRADFDRAVRLLGAIEVESRREQSVLFDTFDGRLVRDGGLVSLRGAPADLWLEWSDLDLQTSRGGTRVESQPRFAWDVPIGPMRARLERRIAVRALLPLAWTRSQLVEARLRDRDGKTVLRVCLEETRVRSSARGSERRLPPQLHLVGLRGFEADRRRARGRLESELGLPASSVPWAIELLKGIGLQPGSDPTRLRLELDADAPARDGFQSVLRELLAMLRANEAGTKADLDSEFLHDFRVAIRRARAMLTAGRRVLPPAVRAHFREEFRWLNRLSGQTRDLDVQLLGFDALLERVPGNERPSLDAFHAHLQREQRRRQAELAASLEDLRYRQLIEDFRRVLGHLDAIAGECPDAEIPLVRVATDRIQRERKKVTKLARAMGSRSTDDDLHSLRKRVKRLRTVVECFASVFPPGEARARGKELKRLQNRLGAHHDLCVLVSNLHTSAHALGADASPDTLVTMGFLIDRFRADQERARTAFVEELANHDHATLKRNFARSFGRSAIRGTG